jgi:hypothetical protein
MFDCNFSGPIPSSLGNLTQLTVLGLSNKHFLGEIPSSISNLKELPDLHLIPSSQNNFNGKLSTSLSIGNA